MAESGFFLFFLAVAVGSLAVIVSTVLSNLPHIVAAMRGQLQPRPAPTYKVTVYRPMEHPRVAKRMGRRGQQERSRPNLPRKPERVRA